MSETPAFAASPVDRLPALAPAPELFRAEGQLRLDAVRSRVLSGGVDALLERGSAGDLRRDIVASWLRCSELSVAGELSRAPRVAGPGALHEARKACDWLPLVPAVVREREDIFLGGAYVLSVFDARGRMLAADGDPAALEGLAEINFAPGGIWSEVAAGTNGPGTALATGSAVQIVGAEHWCEGWTPWHCAAAPIRDPLTGEVVGALDLSARVDDALPHALTVVRALAVAVEERLASRSAEDRSRTLVQWADLVSSYPGDGVLALGRDGSVMARSGAWVDLLDRARRSGVGPGLEAALATLFAGHEADDADFVHDGLPGGRATVHRVRDGDRMLAACLVLPRTQPTMPTAPDTPPTCRSRPSRAGASSSAGSPASARYTLDDLLGNSTRMQEVRRIARGCARTDLPVLLVGASGTGKEVLAQGIHNAGPRAREPFVPVNCGALPRDLVAAELFGHEEGAFSGARVGGARGTFDAAHGGTLFLDEVGELPLDAQATLLRTLEEGVVRPVGATRGHPVDVRVIAATNRDLMDAIARGAFRADLYHRLAVLTVATPTLAERRGDIAGLAQRFLERENRNHAVPRRFTPAALQALVGYSWPGNVRELLNLVRRLVALSETAEIGVAELPPVLRDGRASRRHLPPAAGRAPPAPRSGPGVETPIDGMEARAPSKADAERRALMRVIETQPTMVAAAEALGVSRSTLYRRMDRLGLSPGRSAHRRFSTPPGAPPSRRGPTDR